MATEKQKTANKKNAQHSHGPTSQAGLDEIKLNAYLHGLAVNHHETFVILMEEKSEKYDQLLQSLRDEHNPQSETESILVRHMAQSEWLCARALRFQTYCFDQTSGYTPADLPLFLRYHTTHSRAFHKSLNELQNLRKQKQNTEIGFESQKLQKAAEIRATETLHLKKESQLLKREIFQWKKEAQEQRKVTAQKQEVNQAPSEMAA